MADTITKTETTEIKNIPDKTLSVLATPEGFQKYILGTKKNGSPRAVYDVITDYIPPKKAKKHKKKDKKKSKKNKGSGNSMYDFYKDSKKKKKKKKSKKYWHI